MKTMKAVRRVHLYAGLALCPFVLLFGVSAFLFNHPTSFRDDVLRHGSELTEGTVFDPAAAEAIAQQVHAALEASDFGGEAVPELARVSDGEPAEFGRTGRIVVETESTRHSLRLRNGAGGAFEVRSEIEPDVGQEREGPQRVQVELGRDLESEFEQSAHEVARRANLEESSVELERLPTIRFALTVDGVEHTADFDPKSQTVTLRPTSEAEAPGWRRMLTRMHTAHGYPDEPNARFVWAVLVDIVAFAMVGFGLSGLAMWWQMKKLRRQGAVWTILGVVVFAAMTVAMRAAFMS
ncbi:MAG: hypothetical protein AAF196_08085 [Planctomycetota bacterium]